MIINAGIRRVVHLGEFPDERAVQFLKEAEIEIVHIPPEKIKGVVLRVPPADQPE